MVAPTMPRFLQMSQLWAQADIAHARKRLRIQARELGGAQRPVQPLLLVAVLLASDEPDPVAERVRVSVAEAGVIVEAEEAGPGREVGAMLAAMTQPTSTRSVFD